MKFQKARILKRPKVIILGNNLENKIMAIGHDSNVQIGVYQQLENIDPT